MPDKEKRAEIRSARGGIEVKRPLFAFSCIDEVVKTNSNENGDNYKSYVQKLPSYIQTNGLGQTLGFMYSKSESSSTKMYGVLLDQIRDYMLFRELIPDMEYSRENFVRAVVCFDSFEYYQAVEEVLLLIKWLRRLAEGKFSEGES